MSARYVSNVCRGAGGTFGDRGASLDFLRFFCFCFFLLFATSLFAARAHQKVILGMRIMSATFFESSRISMKTPLSVCPRLRLLLCVCWAVGVVVDSI